jgi:pimeloyl-ACP methyl ester carboxylesterase
VEPLTTRLRPNGAQRGLWSGPLACALVLWVVPAAALAQTPLGTLIDVGGYRVHLYCTGTGTPTVMIIGGFSFDWALVQPEVAKVTRVCTYDASGNAWSEPDPGPAPTCPGRVDEIHRLLSSAKIDGPYVLAGFSAGALFARLYARDHPNEVAAIVLIDHAYLPPPAAPPPVVSGPDSPPALISSTPIEIGVEDEPGFDKLPERIRDLHRWALLHNGSRNPARPDAQIAEACISELGTATLGNLPLVVVRTANDAPGYAKLQTSLLALSHNSTQLIADRSFHSIEISQPEVVIRAIRQAVLESRK